MSSPHEYPVTPRLMRLRNVPPSQSIAIAPSLIVENEPAGHTTERALGLSPSKPIFPLRALLIAKRSASLLGFPFWALLIAKRVAALFGRPFCHSLIFLQKLAGIFIPLFQAICFLLVRTKNLFENWYGVNANISSIDIVFFTTRPPRNDGLDVANY